MTTLLNEKEAAEKLGMTVAALRRWRLEMRGPTFIRVGTRNRYGGDLNPGSRATHRKWATAAGGSDRWCIDADFILPFLAG